MAFKVIWSPDALADVDEIARFISRDSDYYARRVVQRIVEAAEHAALFPRLGRRVPEFDENDAIREVFVYSYRIIYRVTDESIHVAAVVHQSRLLVNAISDRPI